MKTNTVVLFICFTVLALGLMSSSAGRGAVAGEQRAGAPGENASTCSQCHNSGSYGTVVSMFLSDLDGNVIDEYIPNESYLMNLSINATSQLIPGGYGFQMVALDELDEAVNSWGDNIDDNIRVIDLLGRDYVEQKNTLTEETWTIPWVAPETSTGPVTFYACGNIVNGDGATSGDEAATAAFTVAEGLGSSSNDIEDFTFFAYPNPVNNSFRISNAQDVKKIELFDTRGNLLFNSKQTDQTFYMDHLSSGSYILVFHDENGDRTKVERIIKI